MCTTRNCVLLCRWVLWQVQAGLAVLVMFVLATNALLGWEEEPSWMGGCQDFACDVLTNRSETTCLAEIHVMSTKQQVCLLLGNKAGV